MPDINHKQDAAFYRYLRFKAMQKRRFDANGATKAAQQRDAERKQQALDAMRRLYAGERGTRGHF